MLELTVAGLTKFEGGCQTTKAGFASVLHAQVALNQVDLMTGKPVAVKLNNDTIVLYGENKVFKSAHYLPTVENSIDLCQPCLTTASTTTDTAAHTLQ